MRYSLLLLGIMVSAAACDSIFGAETEPYFEAEVRFNHSGEPTEHYTGAGLFKFDPTAPRSDGTNYERFIIESSGTGGSEGEMVAFYRWGGKRPVEGTYQFDLAHHEAITGYLAGYSGTYLIVRPDSSREAYFVAGGDLVITGSDSDRVEGHFHVTGFQWCVYHPDGTWERYCDGVFPSTWPAGLPETELSGSFAVVEADAESNTPSGG